MTRSAKNPLTVAAISAAIIKARTATKAVKLYDSGGLYLLVKPGGVGGWRLKYRHAGKEQLVSLGTLDDVSLKTARERRDEARKQVRAGINVSAQRKAEKSAAKLAAGNSFKILAQLWIESKMPTWAQSNSKRIVRLFERDLFPALGARPITAITPPEIRDTIRKIENGEAVWRKSTGAKPIETAHRALSMVSQVFRYSIALGRAESDPSRDLRGTLLTPTSRHFAAVTEPKEVGGLLRAIRGYTGQPSSAYALRILPYVFVRPGELRSAEWSEFDLDAAEWRIPAAKMKMRDVHIVPLAMQVVALLRELQPINNGRLLFPSLVSAAKPISENTLNGALRRLGYAGNQHVAHSFRSTASSLLNELGWHADVIERQLAHVPRDAVRGAYNRAQLLQERREMMQSYADYLDALRDGTNVVAFRKRGQAAA